MDPSLSTALLGAAIGLAVQFVPFSQSNPEPSVYFWADFYGVSRIELYDTLSCESKFAPDQQSSIPDYRGPNDREDSWGIAQIHLPDHPDITKDEALDPDWAIKWTAEQFSEGHADLWSCYHPERVDKKLATNKAVIASRVWILWEANFSPSQKMTGSVVP